MPVTEVVDVPVTPAKPDAILEAPCEQQPDEVETAPEQQATEETPIKETTPAAQEDIEMNDMQRNREVLEEQQMAEAEEKIADPANPVENIQPNELINGEAEIVPVEPLDLDTVYTEAIRYLKEIENSTRLHIRKVIRRVNKLKNFSKTNDDIKAQKTLLQNRCDRDVVKLSKLEDVRAKTIKAVERLSTERD